MEALSAATAKPTTFVVEAYWPSTQAAGFRRATTRLEDVSATMRSRGVDVRAITGTLVPDDDTAYWTVDAPSRDDVADACTGAGIRFDRIVAALDAGERRRRRMKVMAPAATRAVSVPAGASREAPQQG